jgi:S-DNA-T family DNA segregation ATPase FtsK/SpoIIIE
MFEVSPAPGVRVSSIMSLSDNIALQLAARQVRIVAPIPGKQAVGIEVPNKNRSIIGFKDLLPTIDAKQYQVPMVLGRKITGEPVVIEITQTPHLLIAGATGSGKSVCVNSLISSILYRRSPKDIRLILVDPKIVELRVYNGIPHLLTPVITEPKKTIKALEFCLFEMERRYKLLNALAVRNISAYNKKILELKLARERLPYIVVVIDEFADLMTTVGKELETLLARLAAMARAIGIHLVLATQRPSANVITGIIKSNIPTRIAFMVASQIDSRIIIDETGAEKLLGKGDMLFAPGWDPNSVRIQGAFLSDEEVERIVAYAKTQGEPDYLDEAFFEDEEVPDDDDDEDILDDSSDEALMEKALKIVVERQSASASYLQRRLKIGYNRAARLVEQMEEDGLVGPARGSKPRELLKYPD